ncbi:hypothetical protein [Pseudocnuella soli]|uniref:hypothetical protein n=1 Tax=Pseudocnuella soli TaxID=2502779 RepID=UPI0010528869|nr:hypothetical protein [Pseudocnuella soli]
MTTSQNLERTILLLQNNLVNYPILEDLFPIRPEVKGTFWDFDGPSEGTTKEHILDIYQSRAKFEVQRIKVGYPPGGPIIGYDTLVPNLQKTLLTHICISSFEIPSGTFIIFSDFDRTELIGILLSPS